MGGDAISLADSSIDDECLPTINQQFLDRLKEILSSRPVGLIGKTTEENEPVFTESDARSFRDSYSTLEIKANERRMHNVYAQVLKKYVELKHRAVNMDVAKSKILSYTPGSWIENVGGKTMNDYNLPKATTLLLIGPKGSGKSSLINRISRVFEDDKFAPERAQVSYNSSVENGTSFLYEYMIPRNSTSFCLYDTHGFSNDSSENLEMIKHWMTKGVSHKELAKSSTLQTEVKHEGRQDKLVFYERRTVNFVIFVVNGISILKCVETDGADTQYADMVAEVFSSPSLSFKDHEPAIAITHGDQLSLSERARVRVYLGELLGVHPSKQTFDIPDDNEPTTELTIVDLLRYALEHADRNLPCKSRPLISKARRCNNHFSLFLSFCLFFFFGNDVDFHVESVPEPIPIQISPETNEVIKEKVSDYMKEYLHVNRIEQRDYIKEKVSDYMKEHLHANRIEQRDYIKEKVSDYMREHLHANRIERRDYNPDNRKVITTILDVVDRLCCVLVVTTIFVCFFCCDNDVDARLLAHSQIRHLRHRQPPQRNCNPYPSTFTHRRFKIRAVMGGDTISLPDSSIDDEDLSTINQQIRDRLIEIPTSRPFGLSGKTMEENESVFTESDARSFRDSYNTSEIKENERRMLQVRKHYDELKHRAVNMEVAKSKILSYTPGSWVENVGGMTMNDYNLPKITTLLLIGPKGSGKSSLINRISRVFEDDKFAPERAQVSYNSSIGNGTSFLQEYMIPRNSTSFCLYDTCGFSNDLSENLEMINHWMTKGVYHNELVKSSSLQARIKRKSRQEKLVPYKRRTVNFVIFVVNGLEILKCLDSNEADTRYTEIVSEVFNSPFLSFKDHKPAIVITHGDQLSLSERALVRVYLGELLGVHPSKQTFDIPDDNEPTTELTIVDLLRYALEHADRNLTCKSRPLINKGCRIHLWTCLLLLLSVGMSVFNVHLHGSRSLNVQSESVPEPSLEVKKVFPESILEPSLEVKKVFDDWIPESSMETKKVHEKKIRKPRRVTKKVHVKRGREASVEIDWKKIRHLWYG
ncbi:hypothetical protein L2E82_20288 [Cichorium intybus]|uniref:Uncharacterized protein n=1 Tax=Cichorium intybus TaxID=13427 RepID=A0ACB9DSY6_CICIN|nr:hypothetical protein L2E82_20288 [Cichorium intybus]